MLLSDVEAQTNLIDQNTSAVCTACSPDLQKQFEYHSGHIRDDQSVHCKLCLSSCTATSPLVHASYVVIIIIIVVVIRK